MARFFTTQVDLIFQLERALGVGVETPIVARAGGGQALATALSANVTRHVVTTVATPADSVALPAATTDQLGLKHTVRNSAAVNAMQVYGSGTDTIDDIAFGTGVSQAAGIGVIYECLAVGKWYRVVGA